MALFRVACRDCQKSFKVQLPDTAERGKVTCPFCQKSFVVTAPSLADASSNTSQPMPAILEASVIPHSPPSDSGSSDPSTADASQSSGLNSFPGASPASQSPASVLASEEQTPAVTGLSPPMEKQVGQSPLGGSLSGTLDLRRAASSSPLSSGNLDGQLLINPYAPPQAEVSVATEDTCPVCGRAARKGYLITHGEVLYGHKVCKKCYRKFSSGRQLAFLIDIMVCELIVRVCIICLAYLTGEMSSERFVDAMRSGLFVPFLFPAMVMPGLGPLLQYGISGLWFLFKDGFRGASPGKLLVGIRVISDSTGHPISFRESAARNWPIVLLGIIPVTWVIIGAFLAPGYRIGDKMAGTKVIWKKYARSPVFAPRLGGSLVKSDDFRVASKA